MRVRIDRAFAAAFKIVAVDNDQAAMAKLEQDARATLAGRVTVARSQPYYLDITHPSANKGRAFSKIARLLAVPESKIAVIGDCGNDLAMFEALYGRLGPMAHIADFF